MGSTRSPGRRAPSPTLPDAGDAGGDPLRAPAGGLDPRAVLLWRIEIALAAAAAAALAALGAGLGTALAGAPAALWAAPAGAAACGAAAAVLVPPRRHRRFRWEVTPLGLYVRRGMLWRTWLIVPHARIQSVETASGPLERALGLATVEVRTAAPEPVRVPGLDARRVALLRGELAARAGQGDAA